MNDDMRRYEDELVGTFVLVIGGVGTAVLAGSQVGAQGVALAFGLSLLVMVYVIGPVSGCHINPAVTLGLMLAKKFDVRLVPGYVIAQGAGTILAAVMVWLVADGMPGGYDPWDLGLGVNGYGNHSPGGYSMLAAFVAEVILTAFLVFTVLGATNRAAPVGFAGIAIGTVLTFIHLVSIPVTNTSVNPARSIGPALFSGGWAIGQLWLFIVAPLPGAIAAAAIYRVTHVDAPEISTIAERAPPREQEARRVTQRR